MSAPKRAGRHVGDRAGQSVAGVDAGPRNGGAHVGAVGVAADGGPA